MTELRGALIGAHISRTRLPAALQILCDAAGWALQFELIDTSERPGFDFTRTVADTQDQGLTGVTVTHPHKLDARRAAGGGMAPPVAHLTAANTLIFGPAITGYNTDYTGFQAVLDDQGLTRLGNTVVVGAGGVAQALVPALARRCRKGATVTICDVDAARAEALAAAYPEAQACTLAALPDHLATAEGVLNATPLGMAEYPGTAVEAAWLGPQTWAFDAVYTPTQTQFLNQAAAARLHCITGFDLFKAMAIRSFEAYTDLKVDLTDALPTLDTLRPD